MRPVGPKVQAVAGARRLGGIWSSPFLASLLLLTIFTISRVHSYIAPLRLVRPAMLLVLFAGIFAFLNPKYLAVENVSKSWIPKLIAVIAVLACLSVPFGISIGRAASFIIEEYWKTLLFAYLLIVGIRHGIDLYRFVWAAVIAVGILAWLSIFVFGISKTQGTYGYDANDVGLIMVMGIPLALLTMQASRDWRGKLASVVVLILAAQCIATSESRGAFIGLIMTGAGLMVFVRSIALAKKAAFVGVVAVCLVAAAPPGYWDLIRTLTKPTEDYNWTTTNGRKQVTKRGIGYMLQYPIFGIGINNFPMAEGTISSKARDHVAGTGIRWVAAHNSYVQMGAELGIPGLVCWLLLVFGSMGSVAMRARKLPKRWARGDPEERCLYYCSMYLPVSFLGFGVCSFFVSFAYLEPIYILATMAAAVLMLSDEKLRAARRPRAVALSAAPAIAGAARLPAPVRRIG